MRLRLLLKKRKQQILRVFGILAIVVGIWVSKVKTGNPVNEGSSITSSRMINSYYSQDELAMLGLVEDVDTTTVVNSTPIDSNSDQNRVTLVAAKSNSSQVEATNALTSAAPLSRPNPSKTFTSGQFAKTYPEDSSNSFPDDSSSEESESNFLGEELNEVNFDEMEQMCYNNFNDNNLDPQTTQLPEVELDYEISDSEEDYGEDFDEVRDEEKYPNFKSIGHKTAEIDEYTNDVYEYKYSTNQNRLDRYKRRMIYANKKEAEIWSKERTQEDLARAAEVAEGGIKNMEPKKFKQKVWKHRKFFGFQELKTKSKSYKADFAKENEVDVQQQLKEHLLSPDTRWFPNGSYHAHSDKPHDFYYNPKTGKIVLVRPDENRIVSFWMISRMQRIELLNHNAVHKHWDLVQAAKLKRQQEKALLAELAAKPNQDRALSPIEAAERASKVLAKQEQELNDLAQLKKILKDNENE